MANLLQDIRFALRMLIKSPGFALMAIFTLAIGIGANTAIFTVLNAVLLRPLPFHDPARLVILTEKSPQFDSMSVAYQNFQDWKSQNGSFENMALFRRRDVTLTGDRGPEHINGREISAGFFTLLGVPPTMGRDFEPKDDQEGAAPVAVLSYGLWQRRFGGDPNVLGKTVHLNDANYTVVGIAPRDFWFYTEADVFTPVGASGSMWLKNREQREGSQVVGRLKAGITAQQAHADMDNIGRRLAAAYPDANAAHGIGFVPMMDDVVGDVRGTLLLLFGAVAAGVVDRVRQRGQSFAEPRSAPATRAGCPHGPRRIPRAHCFTASYGKYPARPVWRTFWHWIGRPGDTRIAGRSTGHPAARFFSGR